MRRRIASVGAGGALLTAAMLSISPLAVSTVAAQEKMEKPAIPGTFSANVAVTSEYLFRGISQTDDAPALQGGFDYEVSLAEPVALYLGVWGSNVDFNEAAGVDGATVEIDGYGGLRGTVPGTRLSWDAGFIYYAYPGADSNLEYDFWEVTASLGYDFGVASVTGSVNWSPDNTGDTGYETYTKLAVDVPVPVVKDLSLSAYVANQDLDQGDSYVEWNFSVGYSIAGFGLSVAYSDTDISPAADGNGEAVIFTISRSF